MTLLERIVETSSSAASRRIACFALLLVAAASARAATITVTGTGDTIAVDGAVTLREAITSINNGTNVNADVVAVGPYGTNDTVAFNITGGCAAPCTIAIVGLFPALTKPMTIDGYTQPGASANTNAFPAALNTVLRIELNSPAGLAVNAGGTTIRGLVINRSNSAVTITAAGGNVTIAGNFIGTNPAGTIAMPGSGGFAIDVELGNNNVIGGPAPADRNLLSGDRQGGVVVNPFGGANDGTRIQGNYIGPDVTGTVSLNGPTSGGIRADGNSPGNKTTNLAIIGNLISGNGTAITAGSVGGVIQGNLIGTQRDGIAPLPNLEGVLLFSNGRNVTVGGSGAGQANVIAFNSPNGPGIQVQPPGNGNLISQNSIHDNANLGITLQLLPGIPLANDACDVDTVPGNLGQNYPVITSAPIAAGNVTISGTLNSAPSTTFRLEFFSNVTADPSGNGEGRTFIGFANVTTDATCNASFGPLVFPVPPGQTIFTATATDPANNTSEFSVAFPPAGAPPTPTPTPVVPTATPTPTPAGVATPTPTVPPPPGAAAVPTLPPSLLLLLAAALAIVALALIRRSG